MNTAHQLCERLLGIRDLDEDGPQDLIGQHRVQAVGTEQVPISDPWFLEQRVVPSCFPAMQCSNQHRGVRV